MQAAVRAAEEAREAEAAASARAALRAASDDGAKDGVAAVSLMVPAQSAPSLVRVGGSEPTWVKVNVDALSAAARLARLEAALAALDAAISTHEVISEA